MSADNWAICPRCKAKAAQDRDTLVEKLAMSYGKLPENEYLKLREEVTAPLAYEYTLREDYEIFTDEKGEFSVNYSCQCKKCNFRHEFNHSEYLKL